MSDYCSPPDACHPASPFWIATRSYTAICGEGTIGNPVTKTAQCRSDVSFEHARQLALEKAKCEAEAALICLYTATRCVIPECALDHPGFCATATGATLSIAEAAALAAAQELATSFCGAEIFTLSLDSLLMTRDETESDTELWLYGPDDPELEVAFNDDGVGFFSKIEVASLDPGVYYVRVRQWNDEATIDKYGLFTGWTEGDTPIETFVDEVGGNNDSASAQEVSNNQLTFASISVIGQNDWFKFTIGEGGATDVVIETMQGGSLDAATIQIDATPDVNSVSQGDTPFTLSYAGGSVTVESPSVTGARFLYWLKDGEVVADNPITFDMDVDHSLTAVLDEGEVFVPGQWSLLLTGLPETEFFDQEFNPNDYTGKDPVARVTFVFNESPFIDVVDYHLDDFGENGVDFSAQALSHADKTGVALYIKIYWDDDDWVNTSDFSEGLLFVGGAKPVTTFDSLEPADSLELNESILTDRRYELADGLTTADVTVLMTIEPEAGRFWLDVGDSRQTGELGTTTHEGKTLTVKLYGGTIGSGGAPGSLLAEKDFVEGVDWSYGDILHPVDFTAFVEANPTAAWISLEKEGVVTGIDFYSGYYVWDETPYDSVSDPISGQDALRFERPLTEIEQVVFFPYGT